MLAPFVVKVRLSYGPVGAILVSAILGPTSAILGLCWRLYGIILDHVTSAYSETTPNYTSKTLSPVALEAQQNKCKKPIKNQNVLQNANLHGSKGKTYKKTSKNTSPKRSPPWPCSFNLIPVREKSPPPLAELYEIVSP